MITRQTTDKQPHVFIDCMTCFTEEGAGHAIRSGWVDAIDAESLADEVCLRPNHEEIWCYDHEGFDGLVKGEIDPSEATRMAEIHVELQGEDLPVKVIVAWLANCMYGAPKSMADIEDREWREAYVCEADDAEAFARQLYEDGILFADKCDEIFTPYLDWPRIVRDMIDTDYNEVVDRDTYRHYFFRTAW